MRPALVALLFLLVGSGAAQTSAAAPQASNAAPQAQAAAAPRKTPQPEHKKAKRKLDPTQQHAVDVLESVEGELGRYSPEVQAYLLQEMARGYRQLDRPKEVELFKQGFAAAADITDDKLRTEQQNSIVRELDSADPAALAGMQHAADPKVRETVLRLLVKQDIDHDRFAAAATRLTQWDASLAYPYEQAKRLILKLNSQQSGERQSVFSSAVAAYRQSDAKEGFSDNMPTLILGVYDVLPPAMVLDGIDLVLQKAAANGAAHYSMMVGGKNGQANFDNLYDFELFQLLPVLEKLDPAKAEALRRDHANIAALNNKYPNGMSSLNDGNANLRMIVHSGDDASNAPPPPINPAINQQINDTEAIIESSSKDFDAALASAQALSNTPTSEFSFMTSRCRALDEMATGAADRKNYSQANAALKALITAIQDLPQLAQAHYLVRAAAISAEMNDPQAAKQYLNRGMGVVDELYQRDAFGDPPSDAPNRGGLRRRRGKRFSSWRRASIWGLLSSNVRRCRTRRLSR